MLGGDPRGAVEAQSCNHARVSRTPSRPDLWQRLASVVVLVAAIVGTHQLVAVNCPVSLTHHDVTSVHHEQATEAGVLAGNLELHSDDVSKASGLGPASACLAILVLAGVVLPRARWRRIRSSRNRESFPMALANGWTGGPPHLQCVSVIRR